jgi:hypothetical protein
VAAALAPSGDKINVTWTNTAYLTSAYHKIQRSYAGGAWTTVADSIAQTTGSWTDTAPGAGNNQYRVATYLYGGAGSLSSGWTTSNVATTLDCWVWNGSVELPALVTVWNGSSEIPASLDVV